MDYKQIKAIEKANKERLSKHFGLIPEDSGIYIFRRVQIKTYIGKSKHLLTRLASHLSSYKHLGFSLRKRGLISTENPYGWDLKYLLCPIEKLDEAEKQWIEYATKNGEELYNIESGGTTGKTLINPKKPPKGYQDGLKQGYLNAQRDIAKWCKWFDIKYDANKVNACKAYAKFKEFIECN